MSKPNRLLLGLDPDSGLTMRVAQTSQTENAIWDVVEGAIREGWSPERFKKEVTEAWEYILNQQLKHDIVDLRETKWG